MTLNQTRNSSGISRLVSNKIKNSPDFCLPASQPSAVGWCGVAYNGGMGGSRGDEEGEGLVLSVRGDDIHSSQPTNELDSDALLRDGGKAKKASGVNKPQIADRSTRPEKEWPTTNHRPSLHPSGSLRIELRSFDGINLIVFTCFHLIKKSRLDNAIEFTKKLKNR